MSGNYSYITSANASDINDAEIYALQHIQSDALEKFRTKRARSPREKPLCFNDSSPTAFKTVIILKERTFRYKENLA